MKSIHMSMDIMLEDESPSTSSIAALENVLAEMADMVIRNTQAGNKECISDWRDVTDEIRVKRFVYTLTTPL